MAIIYNNQDTLIERPEPFNPQFSLLKNMWVERGNQNDWNELHELHYKAEGKPIGPHYYRVSLDSGELVGVCILSVPKLLLAGRHEVFPKIKPGRDTKVTNTWRSKYINKYFCVNSRTVVDTLFRAGGVSYRMLNLAARMEPKKYIEIQSSMSRFNPFAMRAGFSFSRPREAAAYEKGLKFMQLYFRTHPADLLGLLEEYEKMTPAMQKRTIKAMREFYYRHSAMEKTGSNLNAGTSKVNSMSIGVLLKNIIQLVFASPMYGVYKNPDFGRQLPEAIPVLAFDRQATTEPLILDE